MQGSIIIFDVLSFLWQNDGKWKEGYEVVDDNLSNGSTHFSECYWVGDEKECLNPVEVFAGWNTGMITFIFFAKAHSAFASTFRHANVIHDEKIDFQIIGATATNFPLRCIDALDDFDTTSLA